MDYYVKGEVKELEEEETAGLPGLNTTTNTIHMYVKYGSKIRNLIAYSLNRMKETDVAQITWNGIGKSVAKTINCAEILADKLKLHQVRKFKVLRIEEYWEPTIEGLDRLKVNRDIPAVTILLTKIQLTPEQKRAGDSDTFEEWWMNRLHEARLIRRQLAGDIVDDNEQQSIVATETKTKNTRHRKDSSTNNRQSAKNKHSDRTIDGATRLDRGDSNVEGDSDRTLNTAEDGSRS
ncbi:ribonuclease P protein subunit p25-like protein [Tubulanus polymorphus]|uniref:ribonuclease P protein subunit p25-like protein n=1 Tax=Tubulanus polymorphus TaxID=672921 RepID=UPI003DA3825E